MSPLLKACIITLLYLNASAIPLHNKGLPPPEWYEAKRPGLLAWARERSRANNLDLIFPLVFANNAYIPVVAAQWAAMARININLPAKLSIVCLDQASTLKLQRFNAPPCYSNMTNWQEHSGLWALRMLILDSLIGDAGLNVLMTDSDAIWLRDPRPTLTSFLLQRQDIIAQRGSFPPDVRLKWGIDTLCMGFALFSNRPSTRAVLGRLLAKFASKEKDPLFPRYDDQWAINHVLDEAGIAWDTYFNDVNRTQYGHVTVAADDRPSVVANITLLPMTLYYRGKCHGSYSPQTVILHCHADKRGTAKLASLSSAGILFLTPDWEAKLANDSIEDFAQRVQSASQTQPQYELLEPPAATSVTL